MLPYRGSLKVPARKLRCAQTRAELVLWQRLRRKQLSGIQFYRQRPIGPYIVDFYAPSIKLVIELDGSHHHLPEQAAQDAARDRYLRALGLTVLRFDNDRVLRDVEGVLGEIPPQSPEAGPALFQRGDATPRGE